MLFCVAQRIFAVLTRANYNVQQKADGKFLKVYARLRVERIVSCKDGLGVPSNVPFSLRRVYHPVPVPRYPAGEGGEDASLSEP